MLAIWILLLRRHPALTPLVTTAGAVLAALRNALIGAYPGAAAGSVVAALLMLAAAVWWYQRLGADTSFQSARSPTGEPVVTSMETEG